MASNIEAVKKYQEKRDAILLRPSKEDGLRYREAAKQASMSLQAYIFLAIEEYMTNHSVHLEFHYGMRLRGYSPGAQPGGVIGRRDDPAGKYHDIIVYDHPLTDKECEEYELDHIYPTE